ncbi:TPA: hypothetical protein L6A07_24830 [Pseudomonas aeruginosa]|nr:hypothetical protein [Pseudomonas aeruginosa]
MALPAVVNVEEVAGQGAAATLLTTVDQTSHMKRRNFALRASGHVRVWPGTTGIKPLELGEIAAVVRAEFVDPMFEVMEGASFPRLGFSDH